MSIENRIGPPVEGKDFYGREKELGIANRLLDSGHSLLLSAPRRIGKSSFAKRLIEDKKAQGWKCVYIDLEQTTTEDGFLYLIIEYFERNHVWRQKTDGMLQGAKAILDRINKISIGPVGFDLSSPDRQLCSESYLNTWSERLAEYREMERPARLILNGLSARRSGLRRETLLGILMTGQDPSNAGETDLLLSKVLEMLENDGYLLRKGPVRSFRSPLLRDYWYGRFVQ